MTDGPDECYQDRDVVSWQDWEIDHVVDKL
jgi:hypothetical protein